MATRLQGSETQAPEISHEELRRRLSDPTLTIVDVLPRVAYEDQHIRGALSLPLEEIPSRARVLLPDRRQEIAIYCGSPT
jgi:rhodanese-related sulfurtransferase